MAVARHYTPITLDDSLDITERIVASRKVIVDKVQASKSVYGVSTGFGGSGEHRVLCSTCPKIADPYISLHPADTRTADPLALGHALLQHQHVGVLPSQTTEPLPALPLLDPLTSTSMPESWVRGAILIRMNSLIRGHSGVRWELIEKMGELLRCNITPLVPLRGSISASGGE